MKKRFLCLFLISLFVISFGVINISAKTTDIGKVGDYETDLHGVGEGEDLNAPNAKGSIEYITAEEKADFEDRGYTVVPNGFEYIAYMPVDPTTSIGEFTIGGAIYADSNGNASYCLAPGKYFDTGSYTQTDFDASGFQFSNDNAMAMVSYVLGQQGYSYGQKVTAARAIIAANTNLAGADSFGAGDGHSKNYYGIYSEIYGAATTGNYNSAYNMNYGTSNDFKAISALINAARNGSALNIPPSIDISTLTPENSNVSVSSSSTTVSLLENDPIWDILAKLGIDTVKYELMKCTNGKCEVVDEGECQKNGCILQKVNLCDGSKTSTTNEYKLKLKIPGTSTEGSVNIYLDSENPETYQPEAVVQGDTSYRTEETPGTSTPDTEKEENYVEIETDLTINCMKDCTVSNGVHCPNSEMKPHTDSGMSCTNKDNFGEGPYDTYATGTSEDPYMNCILNACDDELKQEFRQEQYSPDAETCVIYCRSETEFYMADKTKVYAGMQFEYDIKDKVPFQAQSNAKLSAVVFQKKQCTSEIFYDRAPSAVSAEYSGDKSWLQRYAEATKAMVNAWNTWKFWEALWEWEDGDNKINEDASTRIGRSYTGDCPSCSRTSSTCGPTEFVYHWGSEDYNKALQDKYSLYSGKYQPEDVSQLNTKIDITDNPTKSASTDSGKGAESGENSCTSTTCPEDNPECRPGCDTCTCTGCKDGTPGDPDKVYNNYVSSKSAYENAAKKVQKLIGDLKSCSLYSDTSAPSLGDIISGYSSPSAIGAIKGDAINNDIGLFVGYDDVNYGEEVEFKSQKKSSNEEMYYCENGGSDERELGDSSSCYKYTGSELEQKGSDKKESHNYVYCSGKLTGAKCVSESLDMPINDYATFIMDQEVDFFRDESYHTKAYTGQVLKGSGSGSNTSPLPSTIFPVSNDKKSGSTGLYGIDWRFTNIGLFKPTKLNNFLYYCSYEVYNTTTLYDCPYLDEDGNIDWEKCNNPCYVDDGDPVPEICMDKFTPTDSKGYGFIYRNVDLNNLFPTERVIGNNWANSAEIINNIQANAERIWTDEYLEYSFTLTPQAINNIRNYNNTKNGIGGYLDNSLYSCDKDSNNAFKNCKSSFLDLYTLDDGLGVKINKYTRALGGVK